MIISEGAISFVNDLMLKAFSKQINNFQNIEKEKKPQSQSRISKSIEMMRKTFKKEKRSFMDTKKMKVRSFLDAKIFKS